MGDWNDSRRYIFGNKHFVLDCQPCSTPLPVVYGNGVFVGNDGADLYVSTDGLTYTLAYVTGDSLVPTIAFSDGAFWARQDAGNLLFYSTDGFDWYATSNTSAITGAKTFIGAFESGIFIGGGLADATIYRYQLVSTETVTVQNSLSLSPATADLELWHSLSGAASSQYLFLKNSEQGFLLDSTLTLSEITDVDYPASTVPGVVWLDGTFYVMDSTGENLRKRPEQPCSVECA